MSKHLGAYSSLHGPAGKVLTDYIEDNIPDLWDRIPERITDIANTGLEYTGFIYGFTPEEPFVLTPNKLFFFSPHVHNLPNCKLSINGLPLLPILNPSTRATIPADTLVPNGEYILWYKAGAFELLFDLKHPSGGGGNGDPPPPPPSTERIYAFIGQSNAINLPSFSWNPPSGLLEWNWDLDATTTGSAFAAIDDDHISFARAFASKVLSSEPYVSKVRIVPIGQNGIDISHWLAGLNYQFSTITTAGDPGTGFIRLNNANPALATALYVSIRDTAGVIKLAAFNLSFNYLKIFTSSASAEYTLGTQVDHTLWLEYPITHIAHTGTIPNLAAVKLKNGLDMRVVEDNNIPPALAAAGKNHFDRIIWWQGESDSAYPQGYATDFAEVYNRWLSKGYVRPFTPITIMGISSDAITGDTSRDAMNVVLQQTSGDDPDRRRFINTAEIIPLTEWNPASPIHPTADGYITAGAFLYESIFSGAGQATTGLVINPTSEIPLFEDSGFGFTGNPSIGLAYSTELGTPGISGRGLLTWAVSTNLMEQDIAGGAGTWRLRAEATAALEVERYSSDANAPQLRTRKARGTIGSPSTVLTNDSIQLIEATAFDGSAQSPAMRLRGQITDPSPSTTALGSLFAVQLIRNGANVLADTLIVDPDIGLAYGASSNVFLTDNLHLKHKPYPNTGLPTPALNEEISSSDYPGALLVSDGTRWLSPGAVVLTSITANTTFSIIGGWAIDSIYFQNTTANAITGGVRIGTTSGASDVAAWAVAANQIGFVNSVDIAKRLFGTTGTQGLFIQAITSWNSASLNLSFILRKVF